MHFIPITFGKHQQIPVSGSQLFSELFTVPFGLHLHASIIHNFFNIKFFLTKKIKFAVTFTFVVIVGIFIKAWLTLLTSETMSVIQTFSTFARFPITTVRIVFIYISVAIAFLTRTSDFEWIAVMKRSTFLTSVAYVAFLTAALKAMAVFVRLDAFCSKVIAVYVWTSAFLARYFMFRVAIIAFFASLAIIAFCISLTIQTNARFVTRFAQTVAAAFLTKRCVEVAQWTVVTRFTYEILRTIALSSTRITRFIVRVNAAVAFLILKKRNMLKKISESKWKIMYLSSRLAKSPKIWVYIDCTLDQSRSVCNCTRLHIVCSSCHTNQWCYLFEKKSAK